MAAREENNAALMKYFRFGYLELRGMCWLKKRTYTALLVKFSTAEVGGDSDPDVITYATEEDYSGQHKR